MLFNWLVLWALCLSCSYADSNTSEDLLRIYKDGVEISQFHIIGITTDILQENMVELPLDSSIPDEDLKTNAIPVILPVQGIIYQNINEKSISNLIPQLKQSIDVMNEKHERLIKHIKCVIQNPPSNCSSFLIHVSKLDWKSLIPPAYDAESIFKSESSPSHEDLNIAAEMLESAVSEIGKQHDLMYRFISCACKTQSNCTISTDDKGTLSATNDQYKYGLIDQKPNWFPIFQTSKPQNNANSNTTTKPWNFLSLFLKPNKPSLGSLLAIFLKPFSGIFGPQNSNSASGSGNGSGSGSVSGSGNGPSSGSVSGSGNGPGSGSASGSGNGSGLGSASGSGIALVSGSGGKKNSSGLIFAITTGHVPLYPQGVYSIYSTNAGSVSSHHQDQSNHSLSNKPNANDKGNNTDSFQGSFTVAENIYRENENQTSRSHFPTNESRNDGNLNTASMLNLIRPTTGQTENGIKVNTFDNKPSAQLKSINKESDSSENDSETISGKQMMTFFNR